MKNSGFMFSVFGRENFTNLLQEKQTMSKKEFGNLLAVMYNAKTDNAPVELLLQCFEGLKKWHLMDINELLVYWKMPQHITIYRGAFMTEKQPRLSWSLEESIARMYGEGKMFKTTICKKDIIAYFKNEKEVVALVEQGYETYYT